MLTGYSKAKFVAANVLRKINGRPVMREPLHIIYNRESEGRRWVESTRGSLRVTPVHSVKREGEHASWEYLESSPVKHTGWFLDNEFQDELVYGVVVQLPSKKGQRRYVPGVSDPWNEDCYLCDFREWTADLVECIQTADMMAERYAEAEREYREEEQKED